MRTTTQAPASSHDLWLAIEPIYARILEHPFVTGLTDGSLDRDAFAFYVVQDAHYLREYARALSVLSARAPAEADILMFAEHAAGAIAVERELHEELLPAFGLDPSDVAQTPVAPTNLAYTSFLLATAYSGSFAEALGAVLPCYWIYQEVGQALLAQGSPDPQYQRWIDTYGGDEYAAIVRAVLDLADQILPGLPAAERERVRSHFVTASRYEWMFWDMGLRREAWPV
jgi:thiaminase/transcriptional activator TenA